MPHTRHTKKHKETQQHTTTHKLQYKDQNHKAHKTFGCKMQHMGGADAGCRRCTGYIGDVCGGRRCRDYSGCGMQGMLGM